MTQPRQRAGSALLLAVTGFCLLLLAASALADTSKLDASLRSATGPVDVLVHVRPATVLTPPQRLPGEPIIDFRSRLVAFWQARADISQAGLRSKLDAMAVDWQPFWLVNAVRLRLDATDLPWLATRNDVLAIHDDAPRRRLEPEGGSQPLPAPRSPAAIEWGLQRIGAPQVWAAGITGQGAVVAGQDTGVRWQHQALRRQYRGWDGAAADHRYNWHDAIEELIGPGDNPCGLATVEPCDDNRHGSHTIGTMVGDDGHGNQIGVAPDARWIACRNMERGDGRPSTYTECFQWFVAPGGNGWPLRPDLAPDVINNSWTCPPAELCQDPAILQEVVANVRLAGIVVVASAGNSGSACASLVNPPAIYAAAFTVGATTASEALASFSSRGPVPGAGGLQKPDVVAPGAAVRSSFSASDTAYGSLSGTSMAGPHVAGTVALMIAANPGLRGEVERIEQILRQSALPIALTGSCGGQLPGTWPNFQAGHGRIDAWAAFRVAEKILVDGFEP